MSSLTNNGSTYGFEVTPNRPRWWDSVIFVLLLSGPPKFRTRDPLASLQGQIDAVALVHILVWCLGAAWVLAKLYPMFVHYGRVPRLWTPHYLLIALITILGLSAAVSPSPPLTLFLIFQITVAIAFTFVFVRNYGPHSCLRHIYAGLVVMVVLTYAALFFMPQLVTTASRLRVRGDLIAPTGPLAAIALVFALTMVPLLRRRIWLLHVAMFGYLLWASQTRTAYIAIGLFIVAGSLVGGRSSLRRYLPVAIAGALLLGMADRFGALRDYVVRDSTSVASLSDRIPLWSHLISTMLRDGPLSGLGFYASTRVVGREYNSGLGNAHSAFVEVATGGGIFAGVLFIALVAVLMAYALRLVPRFGEDPYTMAAAGLLLVLVVVGITGTELVQAGPLGFTFWALAAALPAFVTSIPSPRPSDRQRIPVVMDANDGSVRRTYDLGYRRPSSVARA